MLSHGTIVFNMPYEGTNVPMEVPKTAVSSLYDTVSKLDHVLDGHEMRSTAEQALIDGFGYAKSTYDTYPYEAVT